MNQNLMLSCKFYITNSYWDISITFPKTFGYGWNFGLWISHVESQTFLRNKGLTNRCRWIEVDTKKNFSSINSLIFKTEEKYSNHFGGECIQVLKFILNYWLWWDHPAIKKLGFACASETVRNSQKRTFMNFRACF